MQKAWKGVLQMKKILTEVPKRESQIGDIAKDDSSLIHNVQESGAIALKPIWDSISVEKIQLSPATEEKVVIIGGTKDTTSSIKQQYPFANTLEIQHQDNMEEIARKFSQCGSFHHLIWVSPYTSVQSVAEDAVIDEQNSGVLQVFRIIKALIRLGYGGKDLGWTVITTQCQPIHENEKINPTHASLHGLIGTMAKEYPNWKIRLVDLEADCSWPVGDIFTLPPDSLGNAWAYRGRQWYRQQLIPVNYIPSERTVYRYGGVYVVIGGAGALGEAWSEYMIRTYQAKIVWIGRRKKDTAIQAKIDRLAAIGPEPYYIAADAAERQSLQQAYKEIKQRYSQIHGVIQSAMVFFSRSIEKMDEELFQDILSSKVNVSVHLAQVFQKEPLDFVLFFSSINTFLKALGKSGYSSACVFKDAFAYQLSREWSCTVKVINWGYLFNNAKDRQHLDQQLGIGIIEPHEAMEALEFLLNDPMDHMVFMKTTKPSGMRGMSLANDIITIYPQCDSVNIQNIQNRICKSTVQIDRIEEINKQLQEMEELLYPLFWHQLQSIGLFTEKNQKFIDFNTKIGVRDLYNRWLLESAMFLAQKNYLTYNEGLCTTTDTAPRDVEAAWKEWNLKKNSWLEDTNLKAHVILLETTLKALPKIITGKRLAMEVIFPNSSMELVGNIYSHNIIADYFNEVLANTVVAYIQERLRQNPLAQIRILEIGAGTGGTSAMAFLKLKPYQEKIQEYCYTDISKAFLMHAEKEYGSENSYLTCKIFNVEEPLSGQSISAGSYDIVIAANVLHATKNIRQTLRNSKAVIKKNGLILLNELSSNDLFKHLTFGLLEGWWLCEDSALRIPGSPGLYPENWKAVLEEEGFHSIFFPAKQEHKFGQQIIVAESDGVIRQKREDCSTIKSGMQSNKVQRNSPAVKSTVLQPAVREGKEILLSKPSTVKINSYNTNQTTEAYIKQTIVQKLSEALQIDSNKINFDEPFSEYGLDSIIAVKLVRVINQCLDIDLDIMIIFEYNTVNQLTAFILSQYKDIITIPHLENNANRDAIYMSSKAQNKNHIPPRTVLPEGNPERKEANDDSLLHQDGIAVIGMSGKFPMAEDVNEYWKNIVEGKNCIVEIPANRWDWREYYSDTKAEANKTQSKWGGFIDGVDEFDPLFFGISPQEAKLMSPEQRLILMYVWKAIEDSGITLKTFSQKPTGLFVATWPSDYQYISSLGNSGPLDKMPLSMLPNRISYILNLHGPSEYCETGCSSSIVALHRAIRSIQNHECEQAIVGAVNLLLSPISYINFDSIGLLSPEGQAKSFQAESNGFVKSEGVGAVILKPLQKAIEDNDFIYAVIKGTGVAHGGKGVSFIAPNAAGMKAAMIQAYQTSKIDPRTVSYIEANGIGSPLADGIEINALKSGYRELITAQRENAAAHTCNISSLKPCIGHGEIFSGMASLIKVILAIRNKLIPGVPRFTSLHENISLSGSPLKITAENYVWEALKDDNGKPLPRRAGINCFGLGGVNGHVILEEYLSCEQEPNQCYTGDSSQIVVFSAKTQDRLLAVVEQMLTFIEGHTDVKLSDLAYTLQVGREAMSARLALVTSSLDELIQNMKYYITSVKERKDIKMTIPMFTGNLEQSYSEIRELLSGNTAEIVSQALLLENNLGKIALYWSKGGNITWEVLHEGKRARRIPLPTYPFEKRHCWIDCKSDSRAIKESHKLVDNSKAFVENIDSSVGPLVAEIVSELLGMSLTEMKLDISLEEYGVDSLYILALLQQLQDRVNPAVNLDNLKECRTIQDIINMLVELNGNK